MPDNTFKEKKKYRIEAETIIPVKFVMTVWATTEFEASELIKKGKYQTITFERPRFHPKQILQFFVYLGNSMQKLLSVRLH